jgi:Leucine-rich repeat (LRR) protein
VQLQNLDDIATNFRVKQLYAQNNRLSSITGLQKYKFINVLLAANNQLRDLGKFLEFLSKFSFLEQLDLFGNPLAEEPDYRLRIIQAMPQITILDRHKVTLQER